MVRRQYYTMKELAEACGVSLSTVSRVINDQPDVSEETRARVKKVARNMGFIKNAAVSVIRRNSSGTLGVIFDSHLDYFSLEVLKVIEYAARGKGYQIVLMHSSGDEREAFETLLERRVDGIIVIPSCENAETVEEFSRSGFPIVVIGRYTRDADIDNVHTDDIKGGELATTHLIERGRRHLLMLNASVRNSAARMRFDGFERAIHRNGNNVDHEELLMDQSGFRAGYEAMTKRLKNGVSFDALFCFNDFSAFGALEALKEKGVSVPEDVAVCGYDDIEFSSIITPPLTTVRIDKEKIGIEAFRMLQSRITGKRKAYERHVLDIQLIVREST